MRQSGSSLVPFIRMEPTLFNFSYNATFVELDASELTHAKLRVSTEVCFPMTKASSASSVEGKCRVMASTLDDGDDFLMECSIINLFHIRLRVLSTVCLVDIGRAGVPWPTIPC